MVGAAASRLIAMGVSILLVRLLHRESYGKLTIIQSTIGLIGTFAGMGMGETAIKYIAEFRDRDRVRASHIVTVVNLMAGLFGIIMSAAAFLSAGYIAERVLKDGELAGLLRIASLLPLVATLDGIQISTLNGLEAFRLIARRSVWGAAASLPITAALVFWAGLRGAVLAQVIIACVNLSLSATAAATELRRQGIAWQWGSGALGEWRVLYRYSLPALTATLMVAPVTWLANVIVARGQNGYAVLASIGIVGSVATLVAYLPSVLVAPALSVMSNAAHRPGQLSAALRYCLSLSALASFPVGIAVAMLGKFLLGAMYGSQYASSGSDLCWAMIYVGIQAMGLPLGNLLCATGRIWLALAINALWAVLFLGLAVVLIPLYHGTGYFASLAISYMLLDVLVYAMFLWKIPQIMSGYPLFQVLVLFWGIIGLEGYLQLHLRLASSFGVAVLLSGAAAAVLLIIARRLHLREAREAIVQASPAITVPA